MSEVSGTSSSQSESELWDKIPPSDYYKEKIFPFINNQRISSLEESLLIGPCRRFSTKLNFLMTHRNYAIMAIPEYYRGNVYTNLHIVDLA